ncbi:MAG: DNA-directed RNA polymerase subunit B [Candidatus Marsarchaeota archaeon]|nr:DNA-directed RNA polymerase subunit B [Candidatus Marsarchaeota archaeon]MCL5111514.1 DNA-directed RNA polymerase subunit B [Candidatus Marsarchaeota archaeon]
MAKSADTKCYVYLDGRIIGAVKDGSAFAKEIRKNRRAGLISGEVNVAFIRKLNEVHINADRGRARKPYIIVEHGKSKLTDELKQKLANKEIDFNYMIRRGVIEYLDAEEEENALAALEESEITPKTTHLEIDPASIFGLTVNASVFMEFNSVGRHSIALNFSKQSQGLYAINFNSRYDPRAFLLYYPQIPIVNSLAYRTLGLSRHPSGQNFVVALSTYYGYNMKDAVVLNKSAVDRGLGRSIFYRTYGDEERRYPGGQQDHLRIPPATTDGYLGEHAYAKLSDDGIVEVGTQVDEGDVLIGKVSPPRFLEEQTSFGVGEEKSRDNSVSLRAGEEGVVDDVMLSETTGATKIVKVRIRSVKIPEVGDKFASRQAQKGVVALILNQEDMPFSKDGIVPDLLLNPHSLPSRMTMGHMLEMLGAKAGSLQGTYIDGTPFSKRGSERINEYGHVLEGYGFDRFGDEELYDGRSGRKFNAKIFTGVVYYNKLLHMVSLKLQVRSRGPVQILTHQPTEGKPRRGGLKFGEMERDALVGHGASLSLKERMLDQSDKAEIWICKNDGDVGYYDYIKNVPVCQLCRGNNLERVEISYAFKLLLDEIKSMHILPKVLLKSE